MAVRVFVDELGEMADFFGFVPVIPGRFSTEKEENEACCPLPMMLQDLCLLVVVNDLKCYSTELLASLPRWFRSRLLTALPALQLFDLERSSIAEGVDVQEIWKARLNYNRPRPAVVDQTKPKFDMDLGNASRLLSESFLYGFFGPSVNQLGKEIKKALTVAEEDEGSTILKHLLEIASNILSTRHLFDVKSLAHKLVSIQGDVLLSNLLSGSLHQPCENKLCSQGVWKRQATTLSVSNETYRYNYGVSNIQLTPRNLLYIFDQQDHAELLAILAKQRTLRPLSANVHMEAIAEPILQNLQAEHFTEECGGHLPSDSMSYMSIMNHFLGEVVVLRLQCDKYSNIGVMISFLKAATANGQESRLRHFFCTLPDMYMDVVQPFSALFTLQNFSQLTIEVSEAYPVALCKILQAFMTTPCSQAQKLLIIPKKGILFPTPLKESQLASLTMTARNTPSPCGVQHKILEFSSQREFTNALSLILQFPVIRLKELVLVNLREFPKYLHFCAMHSDLQTAKLVIDLGCMPDLLTTTENDLISLIKMPLLEEIQISGAWGKHMDVKHGIALALKSRSQAQLPPLKKISLELLTAQYYKKRDFQMLCDGIFSLAELENLDVVLGKGFVDMMRQHAFVDALYKSWLEHSQNMKLKSITLQGLKGKFEKVELVTQELLYAEPSRSTYESRAAAELSSDYYIDSDDDDEYYGYSDSYYGSYGSYHDYYDSDDS